MVIINKPKGVMILVKDRANNKSKSITVYGYSFEKIFNDIKKYETTKNNSD